MNDLKLQKFSTHVAINKFNMDTGETVQMIMLELPETEYISTTLKHSTDENCKPITRIKICTEYYMFRQQLADALVKAAEDLMRLPYKKKDSTVIAITTEFLCENSTKGAL